MKQFLIQTTIVLLLCVLAIPVMGETNDKKDLQEAIQSLDSTIQSIKENYEKRQMSRNLLVGTNAVVAMEPMDQIYMLATSLELVSYELSKTVEEIDKSSNKNSANVGHGKVKLSAYTHQQYHNEFGENDESDFISKRARFIIKGNLNKYAKIKIQTEFAGSPKLLDGALEISPNKSFSLTAGQFKPPFGTDFLKSATVFPFVNTFMAKGLGTDRDIGAMITFQQKLNPNTKVKLSSGLFNGAGINQSDVNNDKNFVGRAELHYNKNVVVAANIISGMTNEVDSVKQDVNSFGGSVTAHWNTNIVEAEYVHTKVDQTKKSGWNAWAGHTFKTSSDFIPAVQLLARYEQYDVDMDLSGNQKDRITIGSNLYIDNKYTKIQFNYQINNEEINSVDNNEFLVNLQVAF